MNRVFRVSLLAGVVAVGLGCPDGPNGPVAGNLSVRLTSPNSGADSAIAITITGPAALTSATPGAGLRLFQQALGGTTTRFALVGQLNTNATILTIGVEDVNKVSQYAGTIQGVALPNYQLRNLPGGYVLTVLR
ncbi:MAG TPA: hypothetical protein VGQ06_04770 [Gemmatimonadales bacterium]|jgi:hypothetical protein|nr:hypothetical protein [Gemmatimonadales bacterium]